MNLGNKVIEQLQQLCWVTHDSRVSHKPSLDVLVQAGYVVTVNGYNVISANGIIVLHNLMLLPKGIGL